MTSARRTRRTEAVWQRPRYSSKERWRAERVMLTGRGPLMFRLASRFRIDTLSLSSTPAHDRIAFPGLLYQITSPFSFGNNLFQEKVSLAKYLAQRTRAAVLLYCSSQTV
jgi:hypothetical protein